VQIREMLPNDLSAIARVNVDSFRGTQQGIVPDTLINELSYEKAEQRFQRMLKNTERLSVIFVAEHDGSVVGYAMAGLAREEVNNYQGELYGIYILPKHHGKGIGRHLMNAVAMCLRKQRVDSMFVWVFSENLSARRFYEALGGQRVHERTIAIDGKDVRETAYGWVSVGDLLD